MANLINAKTSGVGGLETTADNTGNINIQSGGSTVMEVTSAGVAVTGSLTQNGGAYSTQPTFRNKIINGNMAIDQRNAGASLTITANPQYTLDRWYAGVTNASKISVQQSSTAPTGFTKSMLVTSLAATTPGTSEVYYMQQSIEGYNVSNLDFGLATAKTITISFWVRSSLTGAFGAVLLNASSNRSFPFNYTISTADTWTKITQTIIGDTTGTWATDNSAGFQLRFGLGAGATYQGTAGSWGTTNAVTTTGATSVVGISGATFYITGVQLEVGTTATDFENLQYTTQLQLCQRYFEKSAAQNVSITTANTTSWIICVYSTTVSNGQNYANCKYSVTKRATPTVSIYPYGTPTNLGRVSNDTGGDFGANSGFVNTGYDQGFSVSNNSGGTLTTGAQKQFIGNWYAQAEL